MIRPIPRKFFLFRQHGDRKGSGGRARRGDEEDEEIKIRFSFERKSGKRNRSPVLRAPGTCRQGRLAWAVELPAKPDPAPPGCFPSLREGRGRRLLDRKPHG